MKKTLNNVFFLIIAIVIISGCKSDPTNPDSGTTSMPEIISLKTDKTKILYGGQEPAIITCSAKGGDLKYTWQVDLGDIIPINADKSQVSFSGSACCVGDKTINCTVSNDKGSITKSIIINIYEVETKPEIISLEPKKTEIIGDGIDGTLVDCFAIGGNLKYKWEADCGTFNRVDTSQIQYRAGTECIGVKNLKCTISNSLGSDTKTIQITVRTK
jgi:hypothetical protein